MHGRRSGARGERRTPAGHRRGVAEPGEPVPGASLSDAGIIDGSELYLRDAAAGELDDPVVTDVGELVETAVDARGRWSPLVAARSALALGAAVVVVGSPCSPVCRACRRGSQRARWRPAC
ncbi:hypothetical protein ACPPVO_43905 [Dactylosporangium sp. McL0621]|uniref:hypothetical protein n=1 Tax=Dactylosporangium sp. McL0621 TaxID=3415678 RepID=UPI003CEB1FEA